MSIPCKETLRNANWRAMMALLTLSSFEHSLTWRLMHDMEDTGLTMVAKKRV